MPVQLPLIIAYALSYTVIYANGANTFYHVLGFLPPTAPIAMPVLYAAGDVPVWQVAVSAVLVRRGRRVDGQDRGQDLRQLHPAHRPAHQLPPGHQGEQERLAARNRENAQKPLCVHRACTRNAMRPASIAAVPTPSQTRETGMNADGNRPAISRRQALAAAGAAAVAVPFAASGRAMAAPLVRQADVAGAPSPQGLHVQFGADAAKQAAVSWMLAGPGIEAPAASRQGPHRLRHRRCTRRSASTPRR